MDDGRPFGHSLALVNGDLVLAGNRLKEVAGKANLIQALELRVLTPLGSDPFNTTYGLDVRQAFTQPGGIRTVKQLLQLSLVRTVGTDPRVRDIRSVLFEDDPAYLERHREITPDMVREDRHRRFWKVEVEIQTIDAQAATLAVTLGV
jgi:hypothetical protein